MNRNCIVRLSASNSELARKQLQIIAHSQVRSILVRCSSLTRRSRPPIPELGQLPRTRPELQTLCKRSSKRTEIFNETIEQQLSYVLSYVVSKPSSLGQF